MRAHSAEISVLAAAGNHGGGVQSPANAQGVVPVAAGDTGSGGLCSYASYAPGVLVGPGCGVDIASHLGQPMSTDGGGSSTATVYASTLVALLRTLRQDASRQTAEQWLRDGAVTATGRPVINGERSARAAGLGAIVDRARARMPVAASPEVAPVPPSTPTTGPTLTPQPTLTPEPTLTSPDVNVYEDEPVARTRMHRPELALRWARRVLTIRVSLRPEGMKRLRVSATFASKARPMKQTVTIPRSQIIRLRVKQRPSRVAIVGLPASTDSQRLPSRPLRFAFRGGRYR